MSGGRNGIGCFVRVAEMAWGVLSEVANLFLVVLSRVSKNGMGCFLLRCFVRLPKLATCEISIFQLVPVAEENGLILAL